MKKIIQNIDRDKFYTIPINSHLKKSCAGDLRGVFLRKRFQGNFRQHSQPMELIRSDN